LGGGEGGQWGHLRFYLRNEPISGKKREKKETMLNTLRNRKYHSPGRKGIGNPYYLTEEKKRYILTREGDLYKRKSRGRTSWGDL